MGQSNSQQQRTARKPQPRPNYNFPQQNYNWNHDLKPMPSAPPPLVPAPHSHPLSPLPLIAKVPVSSLSSQSSPPLPQPRAPASSKPPSIPPPYTPGDTDPYTHQAPKSSNPVNYTKTTNPFISKQTVDNGFVIVDRQKNISQTSPSLYPNIIPSTTIDATVPPLSVSHYSTEASEEESTALDCPVCANKLTLPIICCESGHSVCNTCRGYAQHCIICGRLYTATRNIALESLFKKHGQRQSKLNCHEDGQSTELDCSVGNNNTKKSLAKGGRKRSKPKYHNGGSNTELDCSVGNNNPKDVSFAKKNLACLHAGCTYIVKAGEFDHHRQDCYYRLIACPRAGCYWENRLVDVMQHIYSAHVVDPLQKIELNQNFTFKILLEESMADVQIFQYHTYNKQGKPRKHHFIYTFRLNKAGLLLWTLQRFGSDEYASRWLYDLTLIDNADPKRRITWSEKCKSDARPSQAVMNTGRCVVVPLSVAKNFMSYNNRITIRISVRSKDAQPEKTQE